MTDAEVIAALGGPTKISRLLDISLDVARAFAGRKIIPWKHRPAIKRLAQSKRVKLPADFLEKRV